MKYKEVVELLRSLEKTDEHGIKLLAAVLKMEPSEAEELARIFSGYGLKNFLQKVLTP